jgi:PAS domain S-box-containing protein
MNNCCVPEPLQTQTALAESEAKFRRLVEDANDLIATWEIDGVLTYLSPSFQSLLGYEAEDWIGKPFAPLVHADDLPHVLKANQQVIETGERLLGIEFRQRHQQGHWIWTSIHISPIKDATGQVIAFQGILRDISDRKQYENALRFIVEGTVAKTGADFFHACVRSLAEICQVQYAFVTELLDEGYCQSRMLSLWTGEEFVEPYSFNLAGTPCKIVFQEDVGIFKHSLQMQFPESTALATLGAESYLAVVIKDSQGKPIGNMGIIDTKPLSDNCDIAKSILQIFATRVGAEMERHADKEKLQTQQQLLQQILDTLPISIFWKNQDSVFQGGNHAFIQTCGFSSDEDFIGKSDHELPWSTAETEGYLQGDRRVMTSGEAELNIVETQQQLGGRQVVLNTNKVPLRDSGGRIVGILGSVEDITDRHTIEKALQEYADRQTLLNQLVNQIRNSLDLNQIITTTIESIRDYLKIDACCIGWYESEHWMIIQEVKNAQLPSVTGFYTETQLGLDVAYLQQHESGLQIDDVEKSQKSTYQKFLQSIHAKSALLLPIRTQANRVGVIICTHHAQLRSWSMGEVELLKAIRDQLAIAIDQAELYAESRAKSEDLQQTLQELKSAQTQLVHSEKMSSLGKLVAGIAHEINNPVNFIHGNITHANNYIQDLLDLTTLYEQSYPQPLAPIVDKIDNIDLMFLREDLPKLLDSMKMGTSRIREIVKSLRSFSRLDEAEFKFVDIHDGIESTLMILQSRIKLSDNSITIVKNYGDLPQVECSAGPLNQVFMNILANAIDALEEVYRKDQDPPLAAQPTITISTETIGDRILIRFEDNGMGIPEEIQAQIFDPFFTTKAVGKGTGMGMSISYQIITERHGGLLSLVSTPGKGSEFRIEIPICQ